MLGFVPSSFEMVQESVYPALSVVFFILLCTACVATQHILFVYYCNASSIKATSPTAYILWVLSCYAAGVLTRFSYIKVGDISL